MTDFCSRDPARGHAFRSSAVLYAVAWATLLPNTLLAQAPLPKPSVFVREVRIDSILLAFGADSARIRAVVTDVIRSAGRLATSTTDRVPSLDVDVTALRSPNGGMFDPRGFVRVEVGRNLVERGTAKTVSWQGMVDLLEVPTWHEFSRNILAEVVRAVNKYLLAGIRGS